MVSRTNPIVAILSLYGVPYSLQGHDIAISCPFHQHSGQKKKLYIHESGGMAHCFQCGWKGTWKDVAIRLGIKEKEKSKDDRVYLPELDMEQEEDLPDFPFPSSLWRPGGEDPIPLEVLRKWDARMVKDWRGIWCAVPLKDRFGIWESWVQLRTRKEQKPKTLNRPKGFPFGKTLMVNWKERGDRFVLVEGPADILRLSQFGVWGGALLGLHWGEERASLVAGLGVPVVVALDADKPGLQAGLSIYKDLVKRDIPVEFYRWKTGKDPASAKKEEITSLFR